MIDAIEMELAMPRQIQSGVFADPAYVHAYRFELLGDALVERVIWKRLPEPRRLYGEVVADTAAVWYRFWLPQHDQVVERYYLSDGTPLGIHIDVSGPIVCNESGCRADDFILDIRIDAHGRVTVHNEEEFERSVLLGELSPLSATQAEAHLRELTAAIARNRFPPPLVRNWRIDPSRIREAMAEADAEEVLAPGRSGDRAEDGKESGEQEAER
jgi:predicted RNA-binding protein associated with RNAse of E/G family